MPYAERVLYLGLYGFFGFRFCSYESREITHTFIFAKISAFTVHIIFHKLEIVGKCCNHNKKAGKNNCLL